MKEFKEFLDQPGLITLLNWTIMPDGEEYKYVWCPFWKIITDKGFPIEGFRSTERWQLLGIRDGQFVVCLIPGCQVVAWTMCEEAPLAKKVYSF